MGKKNFLQKNEKSEALRKGAWHIGKGIEWLIEGGVREDSVFIEDLIRSHAVASEEYSKEMMRQKRALDKK